MALPTSQSNEGLDDFLVACTDLLSDMHSLDLVKGPELVAEAVRSVALSGCLSTTVKFDRTDVDASFYGWTSCNRVGLLDTCEA